MNKDQVTGRFAVAKGKVKEATGKAVGNKKLEQRGKLESSVGKVKSAYGDLKEDAKNTIDSE